MLNRKQFVGALLGLLIVLVFAVLPASGQSVSPFAFGGGLGQVTFNSSNESEQCYYAFYEAGTWRYTYKNYYHDYYTNFTYVPNSSTGLANQAFGSSTYYISDSPGPGIGQQDTCPANGPGPDVTYTSSTGGTVASGYTIDVKPAGWNEVNATIGVPGYIDPRWEVGGILYAPAGARNSGNNSVIYTNSTLVSVTDSIDKTWSSNKTVSTSFSEGVKLNVPGAWQGKITFNQGTSNSYTQGTEDDTSTTMSKTASLSLSVKAGYSGYAGLDHDWDVMEVWVNPVTFVAMGNGGVSSWSGYGFASGDDRVQGDLEVAKVNLGCLNGHWNISSAPSGLGPSDLVQVVQDYCGNQTYGFYDPSDNWSRGPFLREWASGETFDSTDAPPANEPPGYSNASLSPADFQTIAQMDPWDNCTNESQQPIGGEDWTEDGNGNVICPSPNPADDPSNPNFNGSNDGYGEPGIQALEAEFTPVPTGGGVPYAQGSNFGGSITYQDMDSQSTTNGKTATRSFGWEDGMKYESNGGFWIFSAGVTASVSVQGKYTTTLKSNTEIQKQTTSAVSATLGPPPDQGVDGCPSTVPYPPGIAYTNYPEQSPDCGVPIPYDLPSYGQKTLFNVYEDNYFGSFVFVPVYY